VYGQSQFEGVSLGLMFVSHGGPNKHNDIVIPGEVVVGDEKNCG